MFLENLGFVNLIQITGLLNTHLEFVCAFIRGRIGIHTFFLELIPLQIQQFKKT